MVKRSPARAPDRKGSIAMQILYPATQESVAANDWDEYDIIAIHLNWARCFFDRPGRDWVSDHFLGLYLTRQDLPVTPETIATLRERLAGRVSFVNWETPDRERYKDIPRALAWWSPINEPPSTPSD